MMKTRFRCIRASAMAATSHYIFPYASLSTVASFSSPTKSNLIPSIHLPFLASTPLSSHPNTHHSTSSTVVLCGAKLALTSAVVAATVFPLCASAAEPSNALSLPTWAIHVSSVAEWVTAMALVWEYGEKSEYESWKGLSWGMVPLLGGALCACTWHFFYNSESLEILVALQAALTVFGNFTMCFAAYRIYKSCQGGPGKP